MSSPTSDMAAAVLAELDALGIQLKAQGDRLRFQPRERATSALVERMKACKAELLVVARRREVLADRIAHQLDSLVGCRTPDGRQAWVHPRYRDELQKLGF